jgi:hypothetical protein
MNHGIKIAMVMLAVALAFISLLTVAPKSST